ncbi:structural toxin protein RtxA, partial [Variovorax sp. VRV01]
AEIDHALPGDSSNYADQEATLADTLITLTNTVTVTDGDGDTATDSEVLNIGANIRFDDDGPSVVLAAPIDTALVNTQDA